MPGKFTSMFHNAFYLKPIDLEGAKISHEMQKKLQTLKQECNGIASKYNSGIGLTEQEAMKINTCFKFPPVTSNHNLFHENTIHLSKKK